MKKNVILGGILTALLSLGLSGNMEASQLAHYADMLAAHQCTIRYQNVTPGKRIHARDRVNLEWSYHMEAPAEYANQKYDGVLVLHGENRFVQVDYGDYADYFLTKDGKDYHYMRDGSKKKGKILGPGGGKDVRAKAHNTAKDLLNGESFGTEQVSRLFTAMLPANKKPMGFPDYHFVDEGNLPSGLHYEDYRSSDASGLEAIRYYFKDGNLVKIASASYTRRANGDLDGQKCILNVQEFSGEPDETVLTLPKNLKAKEE